MTTPAPITMFNAFIAALAIHDWYYAYSDDNRIYRRGREKEQELNAEANTNENYRAAFNAYSFAATDGGPSLLDRIERREKKINELRNKVLEAHFTPA